MRQPYLVHASQICNIHSSKVIFAAGDLNANWRSLFNHTCYWTWTFTVWGGGGYVSHLLTYFENTTEVERSKPTADYFIMPPTTLPASNSATFFMTITSDHCGGPVGTVSGNPGGTCRHGSSLVCHLSIWDGKSWTYSSKISAGLHHPHSKVQIQLMEKWAGLWWSISQTQQCTAWRCLPFHILMPTARSKM